MGLLNPDTNYQVIRINKTFQAQGNAHTAAAVADSSNYPAGALSVIVTSSASESITFHDTLVATGDNAFGNQQRLYVANWIPSYGDKINYKLTVKNNGSGKTVTNKTPLVLQKKITDLRSPSNTGLRLLDNTGAPGEGEVRFYNVSAGKIYNAIIRFNYMEVRNGTDTTKKWIDYDAGSVVANSTDLEVKITFSAEQFFKKISEKVVRTESSTQFMFYSAKSIQIILTAGDENIHNYMLVNAPSSSLNQNKPEYTNLVGGYGLFASRSRKSFVARMDGNSETFFLHSDYNLVNFSKK